MTDPRYIKPLSKRVSPKEQLWLVKLMEECAELQQASAKVLRWGWNSLNPDAPELGTNREQFIREVDDVDEAVTKLAALRANGATMSTSPRPLAGQRGGRP